MIQLSGKHFFGIQVRKQINKKNCYHGLTSQEIYEKFLWKTLWVDHTIWKLFKIHITNLIIKACHLVQKTSFFRFSTWILDKGGFWDLKLVDVAIYHAPNIVMFLFCVFFHQICLWLRYLVVQLLDQIIYNVILNVRYKSTIGENKNI